VRWVFSAGLLVRLAAVWTSPSFYVESTQFVGVAQAFDLVGGRLPLFSVSALLGESVSYHLPLVDFIVGPWLSLGDWLGVGGHLVWLRLPALAASGAIMWLLLRAGDHLGAPRAGRLAMLLFAFLPACVKVSVTTTHYLLEMTAAAWLLERALAVTFGGRPCYRSLAVAAAAACWSGFVTWALLAIVGAGVVVSGVRRGRLREVGLVALIVLAFMAPLVNTAWDTLWNTAERSEPAICGAPMGGEAFGVPPMFQPFRDDALRIPEPLVFPWHMAIHLFDALSALLALVGIGVALWLRPRLAPVTLGLLSAYGLARMKLQLSHDNLAVLFPLFLLLPLVAAHDLGARFNRRRWVRLLLPGWVTVALVGGVIVDDTGDHVRMWENGGRYYQHLAHRLFLGENVHKIRRELEIWRGDGDLVVLSAGASFNLHAAFCDGLPSVAAMNACLRRREPDVVLAKELSVGLVDELRSEGILRWRQVALLVGPDRTKLPALVGALGRSCAIRVEAPMLTLLLCAPDDQSPVPSS